MSELVYIGMDGVLADYDKRAQELSGIYDGPEDPTEFKWHHRQPHFFRRLEPVEGAQEAFRRLCEASQYDVWILSSPSWSNPQSWTDKRLWVYQHLSEEAEGKLILSKEKSLLKGDILIDDKPENSDSFDQFIHFGSSECPDWEAVLDVLLD